MTGGGSRGDDSDETRDETEDNPTRDADPNGIDPSDIDPGDIGPMGALIAVAFTGALIAMVGFGLSAFVGDAALAFVVLGLAVVIASPVAYLRFRAVGSS